MSAPGVRELRLAGACYLAIIALGLSSEVAVRGSLVVAGDAAATARNIVAQPQLWRLGLGADLLMQLLDVPIIVLLWRLLRPIDEPLALTATLLNLVQTAVLVANRVQLLAALDALAMPAMSAAFLPGQREGLALLATKLHAQGFGIGLVFFGAACLLRGALIAHSGVAPRLLGWGLVAAGGCYLLNSFAQLLAPAFAQHLYTEVLAPVLVGELAFAAWIAVGRPRPARASG